MFLFPFSPSCRLLLPSIFVLSMMIITATGYLMDPNEIADFMAEHDISFQEIQNYFETQQGLEGSKASENAPRLFPICIKSNSTSLSSNAELKEFANIMQSMEKAYDCQERAIPSYAFDKTSHMNSHNSEWKLKLNIRGLATQEVNPTNMRQWVYLHVETGPEVKYLYIQSIVGPLGLPSGEFSTELSPCGGTNNEIHLAKIIYCDYRSKADINQPVAYFGTRSDKAGGFQLSFSWHNITCLKSLQFILIPIRNSKAGAIMGKDFQPLFSPVYTNFEVDSPEGLVTKGSGNTDCSNGTEEVPLKWTESSVLDRLPFNEDYEKCLVHGVGRDEERKECPPDPLECPQDLSGITDSDPNGKWISKGRKANLENIVKKISSPPCYLPSIEVVEGCPWEKDSYRVLDRSSVKRRMPEYIDYNELFNSPVDVRTHGAIAMLVFLVILPLANFIGRFYRGTVLLRWWKGSVDFWLMLHGILHLFGWLLMWISFGKVSTGYDGLAQTAEQCFLDAASSSPSYLNNTEKENNLKRLDTCIANSASPTHFKYGLATVLIYQAQLIIGMNRSHKPKLRKLEIIFHSHCGYAIYILGVVAILVSSEGRSCIDIKIWTIISLVPTLLAFGIATWLCIKEDGDIGVTPHRDHWPILEHIQFLDESPMQKAKLILLFSYVGLLIIIWSCACISLYTISNSEEIVFGNLASHNLISGLFSKCRVSTLNFLWKNISNPVS